jgi:hypothetical protein
VLADTARAGSTNAADTASAAAIPITRPFIRSTKGFGFVQLFRLPGGLTEAARRRDGPRRSRGWLRLPAGSRRQTNFVID